VGAMERFGLDFDDAYQYVAAEQVDAVIVSSVMLHLTPR